MGISVCVGVGGHSKGMWSKSVPVSRYHCSGGVSPILKFYVQMVLCITIMYVYTSVKRFAKVFIGIDFS